MLGNVLRESMNVNNTNEIPVFLHDARSPGEEAAMHKQTDRHEYQRPWAGTVNGQIQQLKQNKTKGISLSACQRTQKGMCFIVLRHPYPKTIPKGLLPPN